MSEEKRIKMRYRENRELCQNLGLCASLCVEVGAKKITLTEREEM